MSRELHTLRGSFVDFHKGENICDSELFLCTPSPFRNGFYSKRKQLVVFTTDRSKAVILDVFVLCKATFSLRVKPELNLRAFWLRLLPIFAV